MKLMNFQLAHTYMENNKVADCLYIQYWMLQEK